MASGFYACLRSPPAACSSFSQGVLKTSLQRGSSWCAVTETKANLEARTASFQLRLQSVAHKLRNKRKQSRHKVGVASTKSRKLRCGRVLINSIVVLDIISGFLEEEEEEA